LPFRKTPPQFTGVSVPKLDARLIAVTQQIRSACHVDIGSDHGGLLVSMLQSGRIQYGIAIENKQQPYLNSIQALVTLNAEVRFGDGLEPLAAGEAESLSICGMGAERMLTILEAFPQRVPHRVVLQPNSHPEIVRDWALRRGFHFRDEQITRGRRPFTILSFERAEQTITNDPAYDNLDRQTALLFGPLNLQRNDPALLKRLREEEAYWSRFERLKPEKIQRLNLIQNILK
jgi:tRNA (adenine22-N1)-methyltransferase